MTLAPLVIRGEATPEGLEEVARGTLTVRLGVFGYGEDEATSYVNAASWKPGSVGDTYLLEGELRAGIAFKVEVRHVVEG